jgi:hypothetical protein
MSRNPIPLIGLSLAALVIAACGDEATPTQPEPSTAVDATASASNTWTPKAAATPSDFFDAAEVTISPGHSLVYILGGADEEHSGAFQNLSYDLATNTWTTKQQFIDEFLSNGTGKIGTLVYISGGYSRHVEDRSQASLWAYNPITDQKIQKKDMPLHTAEGVSGVIANRLYVLPGACGGEGYPSPGYCAVEPIRTLFRYYPGTDTWTRRRSCPHYHRDGAGGVINGKFYVVAGNNTRNLDAYDPVANTWTTRAPLPITAGGAKAAVIQNKLFVVTSVKSNGVFKTYSYDPVTNAWKTRAGPPTYGALARIQLNSHSYVLSVTGNGGWFGAPPVASQLYTP